MCYAECAVIVVFLIALGWFLVVITIATKGNLNRRRDQRRRRPDVARETRRNTPISNTEQIHSPIPFALESQDQFDRIARVEMIPLSSNEVPISDQATHPFTPPERSTMRPESSSAAAHRWEHHPMQEKQHPSLLPVVQEHTTPRKADDVDRYDFVKRTIAETFKARLKLLQAKPFRSQLFINYAQVSAMALTINVRWSTGLRRTLQFLNFVGAYNDGSVLSLDCLFPQSSSFPPTIKREIVLLMVPFMLLTVCGLYWWRIMRASPVVRNRRLKLSAVVIFYVSYIGVTRRLIRILYCVRFKDGTNPEDIFEKRYWTEDTAVECYTGSHAWLVGLLVIPMIVLISIAFPLLSAFILKIRERNGELHNEANKETFGFMFRGYRGEYVHWDSVIMLRKALLALVVGFGYPLGATLQATMVAFILSSSVLLQMYLHPFDKSFAFLNHLEAASLSLSCNICIVGVILDQEVLKQGGRIFVTLAIVLLVLAFTIVCFGYAFVKLICLMRIDLEDDDVPLKEKEICGRLVYLWVKHKLSKIADGAAKIRGRNRETR